MTVEQRLNPYVGPYAFEERDAHFFFGRAPELRALTSLIASESVVLFYAPSGSGKTSLIQAKLVPTLRHERGFDVLPIARVGTNSPPGNLATNVYTLSVLRTLAGPAVDARRLQGFTLGAFLRTRLSPLPRRLVIVDQFEEILTSNPQHWEQREDFFLEIRQAVEDEPTLTVLLVVREDNLGGVESYAPLLPGKLRARLRMESLRRQDAVEAVEEPAKKEGRPFKPKVAGELVEELGRVHRGGTSNYSGEFVEPLLLQVVCYQLWENLRERKSRSISKADRERYGDVKKAFERFYEGAVEKVSSDSGVAEKRIRNWCGEALITPRTHVRARVSEEPESTKGLPNSAVKALVETRLIHKHTNLGGDWYELVHDRFIEPVLRVNERKDRSPLRAAAWAWKDADENPELLYRGELLAKALQEAEKEPEALTQVERDFLDKAKAHQKTQRLWWWLAAALLLVALLGGLALDAMQDRRKSFSRELAFAAINKMDSDPELGLRLALTAVRKDPTSTAHMALFQALRANPLRRLQVLPLSLEGGVAALGPDGQHVALAGDDGKILIWNSSSGEKVAIVSHSSPVTALAFDSPGQQIASGDLEGNVQIATLEGRLIRRIHVAEEAINSLAFSQDSRLLAVAGDDNRPSIWDLATGRENFRLEGDASHTGVVWEIAFGPDDLTVVTTGDDGQTKLWSVESGRLINSIMQSFPLKNLAVSRDGKIAIVDEAGVMVTVLNTEGEPVAQLRGPEDPVIEVAFSKGGTMLAIVGLHGTVTVWAVGGTGAGVQLYKAVIDGDELFSASFSPDLQRLAVIAKSSRKMASNTSMASLWEFQNVDVLPFPATDLAFRADGIVLVAPSQREGVRLWKPGTRRYRVATWCATETVAVDFGAGGRFAACVKRNGTLEIWNTQSGPRDYPLRVIRPSQEGESQEVVPLSLSADAKLVAMAKGTVAQVWDVSSGRLVKTIAVETIADQEALISTIEMDPLGKRLVLGTWNGAVFVWDAGTDRTYMLSASDPSLAKSDSKQAVFRAITSLAVSLGGERVAAIDSGGFGHIWHLATRRELKLLPSHAGIALAVAFDQEGRRLATGTDDLSVDIWDTASGEELFSLGGYAGPVWKIAFGPDGRLAAATRTGIVSVDFLDINTLIQLAEARNPRILTEQEQQIYLHD